MRRRPWEIGLVGVTAIWGATFPIVKCTLQRCPTIRGGLGLAAVQRPLTPFLFLAIRFLVAALVMGVFSVRALRAMPSRQLAIATGLGSVLFAGYAFQTFGLQRTTASNAGFITGLFVVFTPLLGALAVRRLPPRASGIGALVAAVGLFLLTRPGGGAIGTGDGLVLVCAVSFAAHILLLGRFSRRISLPALTTVQLAVTGLLSAVAALATERPVLPREAGIWSAILVTAVLASVLAFTVQTGAQRVIAPTHTAVLLTMEPVFAGLFGYLMLGDRLAGRSWVGAALILAAILLVAVRDPMSEEL